MIAIPVKTNKENPAVSTLFGKAKWFAFVSEDGTTTIEKNNCEGGRSVVEYLVQKGVTKLIFNHMGGNPFMLLQKASIECFYSGEDRILLEDVIKSLNENKLTFVDGANMANYIEKGKMHGGNHSHHHEDGDHHHHH